jgi:glycerol-3-phosphate dehydrogenase (NAD(P)+)
VGAAIAGTSRRPTLTAALWARGLSQAQAIASARVNEMSSRCGAAGWAFHYGDLTCAVDAELLIVATPSAALLSLADELGAIGAHAPLVWLCKGFLRLRDPASHTMRVALPHQALTSQWPAAVGVISGPSFAEEVARGLPTALVVATTESELSGQVASMLRAGTLRIYQSDDLTGIEIGGAVKNVLAIAAGASDGLHIHNARGADHTRLAEIGRLSLCTGGGKR